MKFPDPSALISPCEEKKEKGSIPLSGGEGFLEEGGSRDEEGGLNNSFKGAQKPFY